MTTYKGYHLFKFTTKGYIMTGGYAIFDPYMKFKGMADDLKIAKSYVRSFLTS